MSDSVAQAGQASEPVIRMQGVHKWFGQFHVLKDINLSVRQGERIVLCGPSGSGQVHHHSLPQSPGGTPAGGALSSMASS